MTASALGAIAGGSTAAATSSIGTDRTRVSQLEQRIAAQGARAETLVSRYNAVQGELQAINKAIVRDRASIAADHRAEARAKAKLRRAAIDAYVNAASGSSSKFSAFTAFTSSSSAAALSEQQVYLGAASGQLDNEMNTLQLAQHRSSIAQSSLQVRQNLARETLVALNSAHQAAQAGISADQATLRSVSGNLLALVTAANQRRAQQQAAAAEEALAAKAAAAASQQSAGASPVASPSSGGYANPLRAMGGLSAERIDQGVDFGGFGPIYALGDGIVLSTVNGGWPGGAFISYRLTSGPASGLIVYAAEDIEPTVSVGQTVTPNTVIGQVYEGSTGIETGWADAPDGLTMAAVAGQYGGGNSTAFGYNFSQLLQSLGAPGGVLQNSPPTGSLPAGWPSW